MQPRDGMRGVARPKIARRSREEEGARFVKQKKTKARRKMDGHGGFLDEGKRGRNDRRVD